MIENDSVIRLAVINLAAVIPLHIVHPFFLNKCIHLYIDSVMNWFNQHTIKMANK